jgi:alpha-glucoside transport system substrate-binding protein
MRRWPRWLALLATVLALVMVAAACGGDDDDESADTATAGGATQEPVSGTISVSGVWTGDEQAAFRAVIDGFTADNPDATVNYRGAGDNLPTILATAIEGGNPPDIATVAQPGTIRDFVAQGHLKPIEFARADVEANFDQGLIDLVTVDGQLYGVLFKAANKSLGWYNAQVFEDAGVEPPATFEDLGQAAQTVKASGVTPYAVGADIGWPLTDLFENIYIRTAGAEMYDQLARHEIPWTDQSVKDALTIMADVVGDPANMAGGTEGALQTEMPDSVAKVFTDSPEAAMVIIGDFAPGVTETTLEPETGYNVFTFPSIEGSGPSVVGGGDLFVQFKDSPAADAFLEYLTTPEAAEIWAARGGFSSPNKNIDQGVYPDAITQTTAGAIAEAESFRFDLSDLQPSAFGGTPGAGLFKAFTDFVANPDDVDGITEKMEADAAKAFG